MKKIIILLFVVLIFLLVSLGFVSAGDSSKATENSFIRATSTMQQQLEESLSELSSLREQMSNEKIPLNRKLNDLEGELIKVRRDFQKTSRLLDSHTLDLSNLRNEIKSRKEESTYISNLLGEYIRNFESRLLIAEIQRYEKELETAKLASENSNLSEQEVYQAQVKLVTSSLERLNDAISGTLFQGTAVDSSGLVRNGTFVLVGPAAFFCSDDGQDIGTAEQRLGSLEPTIIGFQNSDNSTLVKQVITVSKGYLPIDPTLGNAHKIEATRESFFEHIKKGGLVMIPIFALAGAALIVALYKWIFLARQRTPSQKQISTFLNTIKNRDKNISTKAALSLGGPVSEMLVEGVKHLKEPTELIEEVMYEIVMTTRIKLQSLLPFIAISASSAPLLGLLGTVTGIINTFKLITVFGSGDVKTLSGGISEALITTKFGLIVAIPSLLLHAFLSRKARGIIAQMEKSAVAFVNKVNKTQFEHRNEQSERELVTNVKAEDNTVKSDTTTNVLVKSNKATSDK